MRYRISLFKICCVAVLCVSFVGARAQDAAPAAAAARAERFEQLNAEKADHADDQIRINTDSSGYMNALISPAGKGFKVPRVNQADPQAVAAGFLTRWADLLHNPSARIGFRYVQSLPGNGGVTIVRFNQTYCGLDVYNAQATVQVDGDGLVRHLSNSFVTDTSELDSGRLSVKPVIDADAAKAAAAAFEAGSYKVIDPSGITMTTPELVILVPGVFGEKGAPALCWKLDASSDVPKPGFSDRVFIDAQTGTVIFQYSLRDRLIAVYRYLDGYEEYMRGDGDPDCGDDYVDLGFELISDMIDYYYVHHNWYCWDNNPMTTVNVIVDYDDPGQGFWDSYYETIRIGVGNLCDDCLMHEYTHAVTSHTSGLSYPGGESSAINQSFADMWGEWYDLDTNIVGLHGYTNNDSSGVRWLVGEDRAWGAYENMANPNSKYHPDFYKGTYWIDSGDMMHVDCGVASKLAYLLTDGGTFNGYTITGLGTGGAHDLMWNVQRSITQTGLTFYQFYTQLISSGNNLGYSSTQILNLEKACQAVGIRNNSGQGYKLINGSGATAAIIEDTGLLKLKRGLAQNQATITPSSDGFILKNNSGVVVAFIDATSGNDGAMYLKGSLTQHVVPGESSSYIWTIRYEGVNVATIDNDGNMKIWGTLYTNYSF